MRTFYVRMRLFFLAAAILTCGGLWAYQYLYVWPRQRCEAAGDWWDDKDRRCGVPVAIWRITGRPPPPGAGQPAGR
jgi:hypothetical protein